MGILSFRFAEVTAIGRGRNRERLYRSSSGGVLPFIKNQYADICKDIDWKDHHP